MKKKTFTLTMVALLLSCTSAFSQVVVKKTVENLKAGELTNVLTAGEKEQITDLTITGEINSIDFNTIKTELIKIVEVNIQKANIIENKPMFAANTIPPKSLQIMTLKKITLPETLVMIETGVFQGCSSLQEVVMFEKLETIKKAAFKWCSVLNKVVLPTSLKIIESGAFQGCKALSEISIPENVTTIGKSAFYNCPNLNKISILCKKPLAIDLTVFGGSEASPGLNKKNCKIFVPASSIEEYKNTAVWNEFEIAGIQQGTAISFVENQDTKVWASNGELLITSSKVINDVELFAITGQLLNKQIVKSDNFKMNVANEQICILKINFQDGTSKVVKTKAN